MPDQSKLDLTQMELALVMEAGLDRIASRYVRGLVEENDRLKAELQEVRRMGEEYRQCWQRLADDTRFAADLRDEYRADLEQIGQAIGCNHVDDGLARCVHDLAEERDRLQEAERRTKQLLVEMRKYILNHSLLMGECVAWDKLKVLYGVGQDRTCPSEQYREELEGRKP